MLVELGITAYGRYGRKMSDKPKLLPCPSNVDLDEPLSKYSRGDHHSTVRGGVFGQCPAPDRLLELARVTHPSGIYQA